MIIDKIKKIKQHRIFVWYNYVIQHSNEIDLYTIIHNKNEYNKDFIKLVENEIKIRNGK